MLRTARLRKSSGATSPARSRLETSEVFTLIERAAHGETSEVFQSRLAGKTSLSGRCPRLAGRALRFPKSLGYYTPTLLPAPHPFRDGPPLLRALSRLRTTHAATLHSPATRTRASMSGHVLTPMILSAQDARRESGICAAACLATDAYPRAAPISPGAILRRRPHAQARFDLTPRTGLQLPPSARCGRGRIVRRTASNSK